MSVKNKELNFSWGKNQGVIKDDKDMTVQVEEDQILDQQGSGRAAFFK